MTKMKKWTSVLLAAVMATGLMVPAFASDLTSNDAVVPAYVIEASHQMGSIDVTLDKVYEDDNCICFYKDLGSGYLNFVSEQGVAPASITTNDVAIYVSYWKLLGTFTPTLVLAADGYKIRKLYCDVITIGGDWGYGIQRAKSSQPAVPGYQIQLAVAFTGLDNTFDSGIEMATFQGPNGYFICTDGTYGTYPSINAQFEIS